VQRNDDSIQFREQVRVDDGALTPRHSLLFPIITWDSALISPSTVVIESESEFHEPTLLD
jgi:hypothetical protein